MNEIQIQAIDDAEIDTILSEDIEFTGNLGFNKSLMIKGKMNGNVTAEGNFYIAENAVVEARVEANIVSVKGNVHGDIFAYERVEIFSCGHVDGDITAPDIIMESGCSFNGICKMKAPGGEPGNEPSLNEPGLNEPSLNEPGLNELETNEELNNEE